MIEFQILFIAIKPKIVIHLNLVHPPFHLLYEFNSIKYLIELMEISLIILYDKAFLICFLNI